MDYWQKRISEELAEITDKAQEKIQYQLAKVYKRAAKKAMREFENLYNEVLARAADGKEVSVSLLYGMDKYYQQQAALKDILQNLGDKEISILSKEFEAQYNHVYQAITLDNKGQAIKAMVGDKAFSTVDAQSAINYIWCDDGKHFSKRIWESLEDLGATLNEGLLNCVITGKKTTELKKLLMERFNVSYNRASTIVRTETANIQVQAAKDRYQNYGIKEYEILVKEDKRTCDVCAALKGKRYKLSDMKIGVNAPPFHPNCRDDIIPVVKTAEEEKQEVIARANADIEKNNYKPLGMGAIDKTKLDRMIERENITDNEVKFWKYQSENSGKVVYSTKREKDLPYGYDYYDDHGWMKEYHYYQDAGILARTKTTDELNADFGMYKTVTKLPERRKKDYAWYYYQENENAAGERENMSYFDMDAASTQFAQCIDCGCMFRKTNPRSNAQKRCPACQEKYRREYKAQKEKERRNKHK